MTCEIVQPDADPPHGGRGLPDSHAASCASRPQQPRRMKQVRIGVVGDFEFSNLSLLGGDARRRDRLAHEHRGWHFLHAARREGFARALHPLPHGERPVHQVEGARICSPSCAATGAALSSQMALGITHLMTGRDLDGDTVGIAYIGSVCQGASASSLSEGRRSTPRSRR